MAPWGAILFLLFPKICLKRKAGSQCQGSGVKG